MRWKEAWAYSLAVEAQAHAHEQSCSQFDKNRWSLANYAPASISQACQYYYANFVVFDARRLGFGAHNRPEAGSQGAKRPVRRGLTEMRREEKQSIASRQVEIIIVIVF